MNRAKIISAFIVAGLLAGCSATSGETAGMAAEQACRLRVIGQTGAADATIERSETVWGASLVVVRAGGSLWRCKFSGGIIKDVSSVAE
jgi:hypothetical protein